jgi:hypothetical protein
MTPTIAPTMMTPVKTFSATIFLVKTATPSEILLLGVFISLMKKYFIRYILVGQNLEMIG